jgi:hypothetical protein
MSFHGTSWEKERARLVCRFQVAAKLARQRTRLLSLIIKIEALMSGHFLETVDSSPQN